MKTVKCRICRRKLTGTRSKSLRIGRTCARRFPGLTQRLSDERGGQLKFKAF